MEEKKRKIDLMIDFNKLEGILDELLVEFEKSKQGGDSNATVGFSITIDGNGNIDISPPAKKPGALPAAPAPQSSGRFAVKAPRSVAHEPLVESFEDTGCQSMVLHLPGITDARQVRVVHADGAVMVSAQNNEVQYFKSIPAQQLPSTQTFNNGVLELSFRK